MPDFDAHKHFKTKRNAKKDFKESNDWIVQQEKCLNDKQKAKYELLIKRQVEELQRIKNENSQTGRTSRKKKLQPKPRLIPDSKKNLTHKNKIEVVRMEKPAIDIPALKQQHNEQIEQFFKSAETERSDDKPKETLVDRGMSKAFKPAARKRTERDRGNDREGR